MKRIIISVLAALMAVLVASGPASARPNYEVTEHAVVLPAGYTFKAHGHVNIEWQDEDGKHRAGMHFDPNNGHPGGNFIGLSEFELKYLIKEWDKCPQVTWVQVDGWNYHYKADYDPTKCVTPPTEEPSPELTTDPTSEPTSEPTTDPTTPPVTTPPVEPEIPATGPAGVAMLALLGVTLIGAGALAIANARQRR